MDRGFLHRSGETSNHVFQVRFELKVIRFAFVFAGILFASKTFSAPIASWDIPTSTTSNAPVSASNAPASGITASEIVPGSGISINSSSSMWRWQGWSTSGTSFATAVSNGDYFEWTVTAGARTSANLTNLANIQFKNSLTATAVDLYASTNNWTSSTLVGSITGSGITSSDTVNFHTGTQSWFSTPLTIAAGGSAKFRFFVRSPSSATSYIGFNPDLDWVLEGTTTGGPWNLVWTGITNIVSVGANGMFTGTDNNNLSVSNPSFQSGDNLTINTAGTMNVFSGGLSFGTWTVSHASGVATVAGGNITAANLVKSGAGILALSNTNTFSAGTITAGTLLVQSGSALGAGGVTVDGGTLQVTNPVVTIIPSSLGIGAAGLIVDNGANLELSGSVTGSNNVLTKTGNGVLTLSGAVGANKEGVILIMTNGGSLVLSGAAKELGGSNIWNGPVTASNVVINLSQSSSVSGTGLFAVSGGEIATVFGSSGGSATISKDTEFTGAVALTAASGKTLRFDNGVLSGAGTLNASGSGAVQLISTAASTFNGTINYTGKGGMTLSAQSAANISSIANNPTTNTSLLTISNSGANTGVELAMPISGTGAVRKTGNGDVIMSAIHTFSGGLVLDGAGGWLVLNADGLGRGPIISSNAAGLIGLATNADSAITVTNAVVADRSVSTNTNTGIVTTNLYTAVFSPGAGRSITLSGPISGTGLLKVSGGGDLCVASASNSYSGGTEIGEGRILVGSGGSLGTGPVNFGAAVSSYLAATSSLALSLPVSIGSSSTSGYLANFEVSTNQILTLSQTIADRSGNARGGVLKKLGPGTLVLAGANTYSGGTLVSEGHLEVSTQTLPGAVTNHGSLTFNQSGIANATWTQPISGAGLLVKSGEGILTLSGTNTHVGGTWVSGGTLRAGSLQAFGSGPIIVEAGATLDLNYLNIPNQVQNNGGLVLNSPGLQNQTFTSGSHEVTDNNSSITEISGTAVVIISGANTQVQTMAGGISYVTAPGVLVGNYTGGDLDVGTDVSLTIQSGSSSGKISGSGGVIKNGVGTLVLSGSNSYTGATSVSAGRLIVSGSIASTVTVTNSGTLGGTGTVGGATVGNGGTLSPGTGPGVLQVAGNLRLNPSGNYNWQIRDAAGSTGTGYDHLAVQGSVDLSGLGSTNKFMINLASLLGNGTGETAGAALNFDKTQSYSWTILTASNGFTGTFNSAFFTVNAGPANGTGGFQNDFSGGSFSVGQDENRLVVNYAPTPPADNGFGPISITNVSGIPNSVGPGGWYVQNFNGSLPTSGVAAWSNNATLPGWYALSGANPTNAYTNILATLPSPTNTVAGTLYSVPQHFENNTATSSYRAIGLAPSGGTGPGHLALRFVNRTTNTITGFTVSYEMRWGYSQEDSVDSFDVVAGGTGYSSNSPPLVAVTGSTSGSNAAGTASVNSSGNLSGVTKTSSGSGYNTNPLITVTDTNVGGAGTNALVRAIMKLTPSSNSVTLAHKVFDANMGSLANFSSASWAVVAATTNKNATTSAVPDNWNYVLANVTNVSIAPGQEIWLSWQVVKQGATGSSIAAIDNVRVGNFGRADPAILAQPMAQSIILSNNATLSVTASASGSMTYQWRKNGTNLSGATGSTYAITNAQPSSIGNYDVVITAGSNSVTSSIAAVQVYSRSPVKGAAGSSVVTAPTLAAYAYVPEYRDISVTNNSAYSNKYDLYVPDAPLPTSGRPAVVVIHGGGGNDGDKADGREVQACQEFASRGYVALSINYKRSFQTKSTGKWTVAWPQNIKDAKTAVRWLRANAATYGIDPNRIGAIGFSWGGNEAAMLALTDGDPALDPSAEDGLGSYSTQVACAANFYGAVQIPDYHNMNQFGGNGVPGSEGTMDFTGATNNYLLASPASRASASAAPMLLHFGDADLEVMPTQNEALRAGLNNAGAKTETVIVPGGKHSYSLHETDTAQGGSASNPIDVRAHTLGFYDRYLLPKPPAITSPNAVSAIRSGSISYQVAASHAANVFSTTGLPAGWSIDASTGLVTGTMPSSGTRTFTVYATGPEGTASQAVTFTATEGISLANTAAGNTPSLLGYNLGHFTDTGNGFDWFRYSGVKGARVFISASELQSQTSRGRTNVTSEATFWSTITSARNAGPGSSTYIRWSDFNYDYTSTSGANDISYKYAFTQLRNLGVEVLANITASPGTFPITSASDWAGKWELWQHFYAQAYLLARDYDIRRFSIFNEPNNWTGMTEADWFQRLRICSDAIQKAIADVNAATGKSLVPRIYAPNTANGKEKYNTADDTWGRDTVTNRYLQLSGTTNATWTPKTTSVPWSLSHVYNYQKYSMLTHDDGSLSGYVNDLQALRGYIDADNGAEPVPPMALTEYNVRTGSSYDTKTENQDTPSDYIALGANSVALAANGADELFLFKFGQTDSGGTNYGVAKNGTHYAQNASGTANNYGGATKAAEVYRLFNKAAQSGRERLEFSATGGASSSTTGGLWTMVTRDSTNNLLRIFAVNKENTSVSLSLDAAALGVAEGTPVIVEEVGTAASGHGRIAGNISGGRMGLGSLPASTAWLVTLPATNSGLFAISADADAELADGASRNLANGLIPAMKARGDGTANGRRAVLVGIPVSPTDVANGRVFYLDVEAAVTAGTSPTQAHVYGVENDAWDENSVTWASSSFLRQNLADGSQIASNAALNAGSNPPCRMLGQIVAASTTSSRVLVDVTDFIKSQSDGYATFLILQDHRWDYSAAPLATRTAGDIQTAGLVVTARETPGRGPRLLGFSTGPLSVPPAILTSPLDQYLNVGDQATLSVTADQSLPVTYQWFKDGELIPGANSNTLVLSNVTSADAGVYTVEVTSANGTTTSIGGVVAINTAPVLVTALSNLSVSAGDPVTLTAGFTGSPPPSYTWRKDGSVIPGATEASYSFIATSGSGGSYTVTAQNTSGESSTSATLTVTAAATGKIDLLSLAGGISENFNTLGKSKSYAVGNSLRYGWTNGDGWVNGDGFTNKPGWYAMTDDSSDPFEGYRTVSDQNNDVNSVPTRGKTGLASMGTDSSSTDRALGGVAWTNNRVFFGVRIRNATPNPIRGCTVIYTFEQFSSTSTNRNGTKLVASTLVNAASMRSAGWKAFATHTNLVSRSSANSYGAIDGTSSGNNRRFTNTLSDLSVGAGDSLWIRWELSTTNAYPLAFAIDDLVVTNFLAASGPVISGHPNSVTNVSGEPAIFSVTATGAPSPSYQWLRNGNEIAGATAPSLMLSPARAADAGSYSVRVFNVAGTNTSTAATLAINRRPAAVLQPPVAAAIDYQQSLASAALSGGEGSVSGAFVFETPGLVPLVGTNFHTVIFNPNDTANYSPASVVVPVVVNKAMQTITFGLDSTNAKVGDAARTLVATASSGLPVSFTSSDPNVASVTGNTLYIVGPGTVTISAGQDGDGNYLPASAVSQTLTVTPAGATFVTEFGGVSATSDTDGDGIPALLEYAFGGATNRNDRDRLPAVAFSNNELSLTYLARTNDTNLSIFPEQTTSLAATNSWTNSGITTSNLGTTNIGGTDFVRRKAVISTTNNSRQFLRIKVSH